MSETHFFARFARWSQRMIASPYAAIVALLILLLTLFVLPPLGFDDARLGPIEFAISVITLFLVLLVEHNEQRDTTAIHVKLDEILLALGADRDKIGVEDLPVGKLEKVREHEREKAARA